ncbi:MAG: hypothetical protein LBC45_03305 [Chlamydiales bacterium]|jgi:hypothetical protein|nr:hypothetical protein [Chlamydiales bacterium]
MGQTFDHVAAEISSAVNQAHRNFDHMTHSTADFLSYLSEEIHQTSRCFRVTCFSLTASALAAAMTYLQNSSCDRDPDSMLCTAPLKSMMATTMAVSFLALGMLTPRKAHCQTNERFFIPEEGIDQSIEWTQEELESIKDKNFAVFSFFETKRQLGNKWKKQELEWLLSQDKNLFLKVMLNKAYAISDSLK